MRQHIPLALILAAIAWLLQHWPTPAPVPPVKPTPPPAKPAPEPPAKPAPEPPPKPKPKPRSPWGPQPCPNCGREDAGSASESGPGKPVIGGRTSPDGKVQLVCDLPALER